MRRAAIKIRGKKLGVLIKRRREVYFRRESEQGALPEGYRAHLLEFDYEVLM